MAKKLPADALYRHCEPSLLDFETTQEVEVLDTFLGQTRAIDAVQFGIGIRRDGYNLYALGPVGIGKHSIIRSFLEKKAASGEKPRDLCYIHNFERSHQPIALFLPSGMAIRLRDDMKQLVDRFEKKIHKCVFFPSN